LEEAPKSFLRSGAYPLLGFRALWTEKQYSLGSISSGKSPYKPYLVRWQFQAEAISGRFEDLPVQASSSRPIFKTKYLWDGIPWSI
jgi:hypothetical protein